MSAGRTNADEAELRKFASLAQRWWDLDGPFKPLHAINPLRLRYVAQRTTLQDARVLDVGCGGGIFAEGLAQLGARVVATDLAPENIEAAAAHAAAGALAIDYRTVDVGALAALEAGSYDCVTCLELLEHVPDPAAVVRACAELAKPGGGVFFSTINRNVKSFLLAIVGAEHVLGLVPKGTHEYLKLIRPSELAAACRRAGLELRELTGLHFNPLLDRYTLGGNVDVNYLAHTVKRERD